MSFATGFPAIARPDAEILILGSMPSQQSLTQQQYYAHPQNAFWPIIFECLGQPLSMDYQQRQDLLLKNKIALWDVLKQCERPGSMDADIKGESMVANDFQLFLETHVNINRICFNGAKAEQVFLKKVQRKLPAKQQKITKHLLPSTSPANARMSKAEKLLHWAEALS